MPDDDLSTLLQVVSVLDDLRVPYFVCGSWASSFYGFSRTTVDVDIVANFTSSTAHAFVSALERDFYVDIGAVLEAIALQRSFNLIHFETSLKVDIFILSRQPFQREQMARRKLAQTSPTTDRVLYLASAEDTILSKLAWFRLGGETSERQWLDVRGVLKVQQPTLDYDYMKHWAGVIGVTDLLASSMDEAFGKG
ncbi:MAG: hypothetical protein ACYCZF_06045 [Anaerolineae bacterium]